MDTNAINAEKISELIDTLVYLVREFDRNGRIDVINIDHARRALAAITLSEKIALFNAEYPVRAFTAD